MEERILKKGIYRHFKGQEQKVLGTVLHYETDEEMVVYYNLYGNMQGYVMPKDKFMSEVDHKKYPRETQKYRFELGTRK
ncbi:DUF1653 domain-containing protein [Clostridium sp.]|uniref:DUF1653 domain-containing protein n=1 Tax=Clostridium sp. TaxID=1506 RepID=UPI00284FB49E|nr:DUF1653 domain-containing protein [Clostridium sp.]MDR3598161.1 DUF1653 domain-containing protein [Clostridium sp.]